MSYQSASHPTCSTAMKRLAREVTEMQVADCFTHAQPINDNLFEWHFTIRGQSESDFQEGIYHGRLLFPSNYPMSPPEIFMLTPNGVFETDTKICLSMSSYHPETWLPSWSIRTGLLALVGFMPNCPEGVLGHIRRDSAERQHLAVQSVNYKCETCNTVNLAILMPLPINPNDLAYKEEEHDIIDQIPRSELSDEHAGMSESEHVIHRGGTVESGVHSSLDPSRNDPQICALWSRSSDTPISAEPQLSNTSSSNAGSGTLSSLVTSTVVVIFIFFFIRNVYLWNNPGIDF